MRLSCRLFQIGFFLLISSTAFAQDDYARKLTVVEWINEMLSCRDSIYRLEKAQIVYHWPEHYRLLKSISDTLKDSLTFNSKPVEGKLLIKPFIELADCKFIGIQSNHFGNLMNLTFENGIRLINCDVQGNLTFTKCEFNEKISVIASKLKGVNIYKCKIQGLFEVQFNDFLNGNLRIHETPITDTTSSAYHFIFDRNKNVNNFVISNCVFATNKSYNYQSESNLLSNMIRISGEYNSFGLFDSKFEAPLNFEGTFINNSLTVSGCEFLYSIGVETFTFPEKSTNANWSYFKGNKLCLYDGFNYEKGPYLAKKDSELAQVFNYTELISAYKKFYSIYKARGDMASANSCYIEMKDIETRKLQYDHKKHSSLITYFDWKINQFLRFFCNYGTSPAKSLIVSIYVIFAFALFYFFFYSEWDRINRSFLIAKSKKLLTYFQSEQKMEDFYTDDHKDELESYESFKHQIHESAGKIPFFMKFLMKPLYRLSLIRHKVVSWLYRRTEILSGKWEDLKGGRKMFVGSVVGVSLTVYLVYLVLIRSLNSLFLSINTFSTLGFGDIPVKGITRYVAILEGFLGWFLLSIFSVSLISQILQN